MVTRLPTTNRITTILSLIRRTTEAVMLAARIMEAPTAAVSMAVEVIIDYDSRFISAWHCVGAHSGPAFRFAQPREFLASKFRRQTSYGALRHRSVRPFHTLCRDSPQ